jgi:hypothetical protein
MTLTELYTSKYAAVIPDTQTMSLGGGKTLNTYVTHDVPKWKNKKGHHTAGEAYREAAKTEPSTPRNPALYLLD